MPPNCFSFSSATMCSTKCLVVQYFACRVARFLFRMCVVFFFGECSIRFMSRLKLQQLYCGFCAAAMIALVFTQIRRMRVKDSICGVCQEISPSRVSVPPIPFWSSVVTTIVPPVTRLLLLSRVHAESSGILCAMCLSVVSRSGECVIRCLPVSHRAPHGSGRPSNHCQHVQAIRVLVGRKTTNVVLT